MLIVNDTLDIQDSAETMLLTLNPQNERALPPSILKDIEANPPEFSGKRIRLEGKAPVWMFACLAALAVRQGAASVAITQADAGATQVWTDRRGALTIGSAGISSTPWGVVTPAGAGIARLEFQKAPSENSGKWTIDDLSKYPIRLPDMTTVLVIGGGAANWMYSAVCIAADCAGIKTIFYDSPQEPALISIGADKTGAREVRWWNRREDGVVVGIVGDPNSGKSILCDWLEKTFKDEWARSWRIDADIASPTPPWYLKMMAARRPEEAKIFRDRTKQDWSHEKEEMAAERISNARGNLDVTLVDLPGGNIKATPPERIPAGREVIFNEVDLFIILWKDEKILEAWRDVLREHHLENRIFAEIKSTEPNGAPTLDAHREGTKVMGFARGLDRENDWYGVKNAIAQGSAELIRHIRAWRTAQHAKAAVDKAFLTAPGGIRYGAAVLCADGKIFSAGQYSSFNHSTNIHAEQGALFLAAMAGSFAVRVLALASTDSSATARPCGVCRQVMLEHIWRTGTAFDVAMVDSEGRIEIETVDSLLPYSWESITSKGVHNEDVRCAEPGISRSS